ncbi:MaoC/PaaZ C-terminal domain-containing protein [Streptomyces sp. NPDC002588]|uniref:MaoC/PaaZ C-terminal domain-containing protein n=1 Tax=Streptomyces sp. NPDC002588 TaxID=3154419 RepID=UPI0033275640
MTLYFEDFAVGQQYTTAARTITEADIGWFAAWSWDTNPVHTDAVSTANSRFGGPIAHGLLGLSVAMGLASGLGIFEGSSVALLGVDQWRFVRPVRAGDTLRCRVDITSTRLTSRGDAGILGRQFTLLNQDDEVVQRGMIDLMVAVRTGQ